MSPSVANEKRLPMWIKAQSDKNCMVEAAGQTYVGERSANGGSLRLRDHSGSGILAASGVLRYFFNNGQFQDVIWRSDTVTAKGFASMSLAPAPVEFPSSFPKADHIESRVLGVYFADGETCGETGSQNKDRYQRLIDSMRKDAEEALALADTLPMGKFEAAVRTGLLKPGPYARNTTSQSNSTFLQNLMTPKGGLIPEYQSWLKRWIAGLAPQGTKSSSAEPAKSFRPKR